ncbi:HAD family hydrolase [Kibdelosporangium phytohabitans]|uniref:HAD family hydrolase n=1 Tax=Kibdelosporangium phytohabitans TaxID=860235 RepID=UPI000A9ED682|nr:HAD family hydrolase [Kibdelosporangium phytohabitans]MBE1465199.1 phosphoglycolate phosphatase-like HAD superfamily hydrolase [Kibdelosporangium phytohabitans]
MAIEHIVWDWNGTLFDDGPALVLATADAFAAAGLPEVTPERFRDHFTRPITDFYEKLAGRPLTGAEQAELDERFQLSYARRIAAATLHPDTVNALTTWHESGRSQSLLSMYPHELLVEMAQLSPIAAMLSRVDGTPGGGQHGKEPHLRSHLEHLDVDPGRVLVVGDNVDDVVAAQACGAKGVLYHPGDTALLSMARAEGLAVPIASSLTGAVRLALTFVDEFSGGGHDT